MLKHVDISITSKDVMYLLDSYECSYKLIEQGEIEVTLEKSSRWYTRIKNLLKKNNVDNSRTIVFFDKELENYYLRVEEV